MTSNSPRPCPICGGASPDIVQHELYDDRYGYPGGFDLLRCGQCAHQYLDAEFSPAQISNLYSKYYPRSTYLLEDHKPREPREGLEAWLDGVRSAAFLWVPPNVRVLDIGCGFGETLGYHMARGCNAHGIDADENIRRVADRFGYNARVGLFDASTYESDSFDWVTLDQVLEHMESPVTALQGIAAILKADGRIVISVPNVNGWGSKVFGRKWINWHTPYHLNFFSKKSMRSAARQCGLILETTTTITPSAWLQYQWIHIMKYPAQGKASPFWVHLDEFTRVQRRLLWLLSISDRLRISHLLTRLFDRLGLGDSRIYVLRKA